MPAIDHLVYASPDLAEGVRRIEKLTGVVAVPGGAHPGLGTHNALLAFDSTTYFEIIGIDPEQPEPQWGRAFGLREDTVPGLVAYAVHPVGGESLEDVVSVMRSLGFDPGDIAPMSRDTPDGQRISWRLTLPGDPGASAEGALPFVIDWGETPSPAGSLPSMGTLDRLCLHHPDAEVRAAATGLGLRVEVDDGPAGLEAFVDTRAGRVSIS